MAENMYQLAFEKLVSVISDQMGIRVEKGDIIIRGCCVSSDPMLARLVEQRKDEMELFHATEINNQLLKDAQEEHERLAQRTQILQEKVIANKAYFQTHSQQKGEK